MNTRILILLIGLQLISAEYTWNGQEWVWTEPKISTKVNIDDGLLSNDIGSGDIIDDDDDDEDGSGDIIPLQTTEST